METRLSKARRDLLTAARRDFVHIFIRSAETLAAYEERSRRLDHNRPEEQTGILEIKLYDHQRLPVPVRRLSNLLLQTPSIDTLRIDLRPLSKLKGSRLFHNINLPQLRIFSCTGIPHSTLVDFLSRHNELRTISIGRCLEGTCALSTLSAKLNLTTITGPSSCMHGLVSRMTEHVVVTCQDPNVLTVNKNDVLLARLKAVGASVYSFSTEFFPEDLEFTWRLCDAMPDIAILRLKEAPIRTGDQAVSFPWSNRVGMWNAGIHKMRRLRRLEIQTISPPVAGMHPGEVLAELGLIRTWVDGRGAVDLTEINLRYACEGALYLSSWVRTRGSKAWTQAKHLEV